MLCTGLPYGRNLPHDERSSSRTSCKIAGAPCPYCANRRSRRIIEARWLREKDTATLHELAAEFKVSAERIRQIEAKALAKMKGVLASAA